MNECLIVCPKSPDAINPLPAFLSRLLAECGFASRHMVPSEIGPQTKDMQADLIVVCKTDENACRLAAGITGIPILYVADRDTPEKLLLDVLENGGEYIREPFSGPLFCTRVRALIKRSRQIPGRTGIRISENLVYLPGPGMITDGERSIVLTGSERKVMDLLAEKRPDVVGRRELMMVLWQTDEFICDGSLTTCISRLRRKIKAVWNTPLIETKKGTGYRIP